MYLCFVRAVEWWFTLKDVIIVADSTNSEHFATPMGVLVETIYGNSSKTMSLPGGVTAFVPTQPLAMTMLDSLTIHAKMRSDMNIYVVFLCPRHGWRQYVFGLSVSVCVCVCL